MSADRRAFRSSKSKANICLTTKLYWEHPYSKDFTAKTGGSDGTRVELDKTLFYPRGGGVSCDTGVLGGMKVVETSKDGNKILHTLESPASLAAGQTVTGRIDWDRRHRLMRMHTAGHLLRSEEHTSELQSHLNLVCRLLLEKKKNPKPTYATCHWRCAWMMCVLLRHSI